MKNLLAVKVLNNCYVLDFWETYFENGKCLSVLVNYAEIRVLKNKTENALYLPRTDRGEIVFSFLKHASTRGLCSC